MTGLLKDKIILVTGGGAGIGAACVRRGIEEGAHIIWSDIDPDADTKLDPELQSRSTFLHHDVSNPADWARVEARLAEEFGHLHGLVNNAGMYRKANIETATLESFQQVLSVNLNSAFMGCQCAIRLMKKDGGTIVNLASIAAEKPGPASIGYGVSKAGIVNLTKSVAAHCDKSDYAIRCNAISPGAVDTDMRIQALGKPSADKSHWRQPKSVAAPEDIAEGIVFLLSDKSRYITGANLLMDGGRLL